MTATVSTTEAIDQALFELAGRKDEWARLSMGERIRLLDGLRRRTDFAALRWVTAAVEAKGLSAEQAGEEWLQGPYAVLRAAAALGTSLRRLAAGHTTFKPGWVRVRPDGQTVVRVLPVDWFEPLVLSGYRVDQWMRPGVTPANLAEHTAPFYREAHPSGRVCGVLGAGNVGAIPPLDALSKLFGEGEVVALKLNPVNDYLGPIFEEIFYDFLERGFMRILYGGANVGASLVRHPLVDTVHLTGSGRTHDAIVFGDGPEGAMRRQAEQPVLTKPISSELGGVSPFIVVPGPWSRADYVYQAENFLTQKLLNGGFNCIAAQVLVLADAWAGTDLFLDQVHRLIEAQPVRPAYYPGGDARRNAVAAEAGSMTIGASPCTHLVDLDPDADHRAFTEEFFSAAFASTRLPRLEPGEFLDTAVEFANQRLAGNLGAVVVVHPATRRALGERFDRAIAGLRYGGIGVNVWSAFNFLTPRAAWGAFAGNRIGEVESGIGAVHNTLLFDRPEKSVAYGPFRPLSRSWSAGELHVSPKPPWFLTARTGPRTSELFTRFAADHGLRHIPPLMLSALRG
ncbi:MAG TPA: aldehyde dehydrogenase family protein [Acidimicrobiia bacterium]